MKDGLYIAPAAGTNFQLVSEVDFETTLQVNDLTKPDSQQSSYTNAITIPDTNAIRELLRGCEQIDAGGPNPYQLLPAHAVQAGEITFQGFARLTRFQGGWSVELDEGKTVLYEQLETKSLRDLNLSHLNHKWDIPTISVLNTLGGDIYYPVIDYGTIGPGNVPYDALFPTVRVKALIGQMLREVGYTPVGDWVRDPLFEKMAVPFSESEATGRDQKWVDDRTSRVTIAPGPPTLMTGGKLNQILPFTIDGGPDKRFADGSLNCFNTVTYSYTAPDYMRVKVVASQGFNISIDFGSVEVKLQLEKNGAFVAQGYWSKGGPHNKLFNRDEKVDLIVDVDLQPGDELKVRRIVEKRSPIAQWTALIYNDPNNIYASFLPDKSIKFGDSWPVARNLPDLKCSDLFLSIAFLMSGWYRVNDLRRTVELVRLTDQTQADPVDISRLINEAVEPSLTPSLGGYGQKNYLKWKEADDVDKGYGDGLITVDGNTLKADQTLFTLPFSASMDSKVDVVGYGKPLKIETRTTTVSGENTTLTKKSASPRIILIEPGKTFEMPTKILSGTTIVDSKVTLIGAWFASQPTSIYTDDSNYSLCFDPVAGQVGQVTLIQRYYGGLKSVLRRPRTFTVSLFLRPGDLMDLDLARPVQLRRIRIGAQEIGNVTFLINKINAWKDGYPSEVTLIPFYPGGIPIAIPPAPVYNIPDTPPLET